MPSATESKPETRKVVSIVGPTASGKTGLGIAIAKALEAKGEQAEIVNADAYQMYKGMDIGTAKASPEEQAEVTFPGDRPRQNRRTAGQGSAPYPRGRFRSVRPCRHRRHFLSWH